MFCGFKGKAKGLCHQPYWVLLNKSGPQMTMSSGKDHLCSGVPWSSHVKDPSTAHVQLGSSPFDPRHMAQRKAK